MLPESISNQADRELIKTHRTTAPGYGNFSYRPILSDETYYIVIITMIEVNTAHMQTEFKNKGDRVFNLKLGDEIVHTVDILAEAGPNKMLHKWLEFDLREDIVYLNGTLVNLE